MIGRALDRIELADVMARADALYARCGDTLRDSPLQDWVSLLEEAPELQELPVPEHEREAYRELILGDVHRMMSPAFPGEDGT